MTGYLRRSLALLLTAVLLCSLSAVAMAEPIAAYTEDSPEKCTSVYVGKAVSAEGTTLIARSEDQGSGAYNKLFFVQPATQQSGGVIVDTGEDQNGFSVEIPEATLKYTYLLDATDAADGPYYASCMNELGVAVVGTVSTSVSEEYRALDPVKETGAGLRESILPGVIACQATSAEDAVHVLAAYVDRYGSEEWNTLLFSDPNEAWIFEIYGGSTYAALRLPEDQMAVFGNEIMIGWVDLEETDGCVYSANLKDILDQLANPVIDDQGRYHLAMSIEPGPRSPYSNMRAWRGHQLFAPASTGAYSDDEFYSLLFTPEEKVSVLDVMQLYGDRYEGTEFDLAIPGNEGNRAIGTTRQSDVHIIQTFADLPANTCQVQWLTMGNAEHAIFVPAFSGITDTYEKYKIDNDESGVVNDSYYYVCKAICAIAETDRAFLSQGVKDYNLAQEQQMLADILAALPTVQAKYAESQESGDAYVTALATEMAETQYNNAKALFSKLFYVQMDNLNDRANNARKHVFEMPQP